jgi:alpha,alpha-trehalase
MTTTPIADYALLSDRHSGALVSRDGSVDWLCFPRFDGPSVFGRLLDEGAGHWSVRPVGPFRATRRYLPETMVLETTFHTDTGVVVLIDALVLGPENGQHRLGVGVPHMLVRRLTVTAGSVLIEVRYRPRPEYGLITPILRTVDGGVTTRGGAEWLVLTSPMELTMAAAEPGGPGGGEHAGEGGIESDGEVGGETMVSAGETLHLALHRSTLGERPARIWEQEALASCVDETIAAWRSWSSLHRGYTGPWRELVQHSGRVLHALSFQPSGAIVAAPTTSLPETVGGERNWDYRFTWVRDASLTMEALWVAACPDEADDFFAFLTTAAPSLTQDRTLQIMFGVGGEHDLSERTLPHLGGWRGSRPVRVGNGAWSQRQIDVYGELLNAAHVLADQLTGLDSDTRRFLVGCADAAAERWMDTDHGIWEVRGEPRHFLYSKVMCWTALDRAIRLADQIGGTDRVPFWRSRRDEIRRAVLQYGWNARTGAFTQYFGSQELDASSLVIPMVGFLPATDPRVLATIDATERHLTDRNGLVYRYRTNGDGGGIGAHASAGADSGAAGPGGGTAPGRRGAGSGIGRVDGLPGGEGSFLLCTFWLAQAMALAGQVDRAKAVFERAAACVNDVGLMAEEVDPETGELLGNFPQAFSHIGLVNAAWAISQAAEGAPAATMTR